MYLQYSNDVEELELIQRQPLELDHVELDLHSLLHLSDYVTIVHAVLWCCRPRSLKLNSDFDFIDIEERSHVIEVKSYMAVFDQSSRDMNFIRKLQFSC